MSVNTSLASLSQTASSNGPDGSVDPPSALDDAQRYLGSFIAQLRDGVGFTYASTRTSCKGLRGANNTGTPTTKLDLSADEVCLRNAAGVTVSVTGVTTKTLDFGLAGPAANGRDQAGVFSSGQFLNVFWIYNPGTTTMALTATTAASNSAPALPSGYTFYAYATTIRWNGSSNIVPCVITGATHSYVLAQQILSGGNSTVEAGVGLSAFVPSNALSYSVEVSQVNGAGTQQNSSIRHTAGSNFYAPLVGAVSSNSSTVKVPYVTAFIYYLTTSTGNIIVLQVQSYTVSNGDS